MDVELHGQGLARSELTRSDIEAMWQIFQEHYDQAERDIFKRDLDGKNWVVLVRDEQQAIQGFSTLALYETTVAGRPHSVVYSGDTIIRPEFWGTPELPRTWIKTVLRASAGMVQPLYWLLISAGYKTYRFLPIFFKEFYPCYNCPTPPDVQALMDQLARQRFGSDYSAETGIARFRVGATPLRAGIAEVTEERLKDPHVAFFVGRNPGHAQGDELVCLTQVHPSNFTAAGRRLAR
jgi:hypothetical protein